MNQLWRLLEPVVEPSWERRGRNEVLHLHHVELAGAEHEVLGVISFLKALPICAIPKGGFLRAVVTTLAKFVNIPWAVSGRR